MQKVHNSMQTITHYYYRLRNISENKDRECIQGTILLKPIAEKENWLISRYELDKLKPYVYDSVSNPTGKIEFKKQTPGERPTTITSKSKKEQESTIKEVIENSDSNLD